MNETKRCKRCGTEYPSTTEYFRMCDGRYLGNICRNCIRKQNSEYQKQHREERNAYGREYRKTEKHREYIRRYNEIHKNERRAYFKKYEEQNKDKIRAYRQEWYAQNRERLLPIRKAWNDAHKDEHREYYKEYNKANKDHLRVLRHNHYENNKEKSFAYAQERRARKRGAPSGMTESDWEYAIQFFENRCAYCGSETDKLTREHVVPLVNGGGYTKDNIIPVCLCCNLSKNKKTLGEWYPKQPFYTKEKEENIIKYINRMVG